MADQDRQRQLSLVPYTSNQSEVVLRHGNAIVTIDPSSQQMILRDTNTETVEHGSCPLCHRSYTDDHDTFHDSPSSPGPNYVNPDYFRLLAERGPNNGSPATSPARPLRALRSGESRTVSSSGPPSGAEFIGSSPAPTANDKSSQSIKNSSFLPGYFKRFFVERRTLGRGGRGVVLLVEHLLDGVTLGEFACKRIPVGNDHDWLAKVLVEVQLLQRLNHPNLVAYRHVWLEDAKTTNFGPSVPCVFILQQYCNAGDLHQYVQHATSQPSSRDRARNTSPANPITSTGPLSLDEILKFFMDITSGLHHLHTNGYIHRDLKPSNCLLHSDGRKITVHVSDFGEVQAATAKRASTGATGTISYCAPEVLQRETPSGAYGNFTTKSDIFSLGMILFYMCFAALPYAHANIDEINEDLDLLRAEISAWTGFSSASARRGDLPDRLYDVLRRLLSPAPHDRPSTAEILASATGAGFVADEAESGAKGGIRRRDSFRKTWIASGRKARGRSPSGAEGEEDVGKPRFEPERLLLPPPPVEQSHVASSAGYTIYVAVLFAIKILSLTWPCLPFAPRPVLMYPLLGLAAWEMTAPPSVAWSAAGLIVHFGAIAWNQTIGGGVCSG